MEIYIVTFVDAAGKIHNEPVQATDVPDACEKLSLEQGYDWFRIIRVYQENYFPCTK